VSPEQKTFLLAAAAAAAKSGHIFPEMAACEAALESSYGRSVLATEDRNLFGMKQHQHAVFETCHLPTREFEKGEWITTTAAWVKYPDWAACFADRMSTLKRLSSTYGHYAAALAAKDARTYIEEVSKTWATDPQRGAKVLMIYEQMADGWDRSPFPPFAKDAKDGAPGSKLEAKS